MADNDDGLAAPNCRLVTVTWLDSRYPNAKWEWLSRLGAFAPVKCYSVGWIVRETDDVVVVAQSLADTQDSDSDRLCSGLKIIPRVSVLNIERLIEMDEEDEEATEAAE